MPGPQYKRVESQDEINVQNDDRVQIEIASQRDINTIKNSKTHVITIVIIFCYFVLSIGLTFYNNWTFRTFKYPLFVTTYHLCIKFILSLIVRALYKYKTGKSRMLLDWQNACLKIGPTGFCSALDIGFSSWGLELVTISLYTMTKSSTIIFILIFSIVLGLEKWSCILLAIVAMISSGLCMFTYKATQFDLLGFSLVLFAAFISGIRWSVSQLIMQKSKLGLQNPLDMLFHLQFFMVISIIPITVIFEGEKIYKNSGVFFSLSTDEQLLWIIKLSVGAFVAFVMELSEFLTLSYTSSLTLSVVGIFKEICQLVLAVEFNHDQLTSLNILGLVLCLGGILCHVMKKYWSYTKEQEKWAQTINFESRSKRSLNDRNGIQVNHTGQRVPLLEDDAIGFSDSDDQNEDNSNVIFDILKRRDVRR